MHGNNLKTEAAANGLLPISASERIQAIDVLRGLAMFGVLIAFTVWNLGGPPLSTLGAADNAIDSLLGFFVDSKAYTLLAFLFGVGFSIQMTRAESSGANIVPTYLRRLFALMAIGFAHAVLLRNGDILVPYATMGFVLLLFRNASDRTLLIAAFVSSFITLAAHVVWDMTGLPFPARPNTEGWSHLAANLAWLKYWYTTAITVWPASLPMFLFGHYIGRSRILENVEAHKKGLRLVMVGGFVLGALAYFGRSQLAGMLGRGNGGTTFVNLFLVYLGNIHAWSLAAAYASTVLLLMQRELWRRIFSPLAAVGRMALTNYIMQAAVIIPICIVFDLYDRVTPSFGLLMAVLLWILQVLFSVLWLKYFRFGPAEWVWRSLTYKSPQPMRRAITRVPHGQDTEDARSARTWRHDHA